MKKALLLMTFLLFSANLCFGAKLSVALTLKSSHAFCKKLRTSKKIDPESTSAKEGATEVVCGGSGYSKTGKAYVVGHEKDDYYLFVERGPGGKWWYCRIPKKTRTITVDYPYSYDKANLIPPSVTARGGSRGLTEEKMKVRFTREELEEIRRKHLQKMQEALAE